MRYGVPIKEDRLTYLARQRKKCQHLALPLLGELSGDDLYREHPLWNPSFFVRDDDSDLEEERTTAEEIRRVFMSKA